MPTLQSTARPRFLQRCRRNTGPVEWEDLNDVLQSLDREFRDLRVDVHHDLTNTDGFFFCDGSRVMTGNIRLNDYYLSNDGGDEGISVSDTGVVSTSGDLIVGGNITIPDDGYIMASGGGQNSLSITLDQTDQQVAVYPWLGIGSSTIRNASYDGDGNNLVMYSVADAGMTIHSGTDEYGSIYFREGNGVNSGTDRGMLQWDHASDKFYIIIPRTGVTATRAVQVDAKQNFRIGGGSFGAQTFAGANGTYALSIGIGTEPDGEISDSFLFYAKDIVAGNAWPHVRSENATSGPVLLGSGSSTDNAVIRWDGTGGNLLQDSNISVDDTGNLTIGIGAAGVDYTLTFDGETNDGIITWMEDEDYFQTDDTFICGALTVSDGGSVNVYEDITWLGATGENLIKMPDNLADALSIQEAANKYITFDTTNTKEQIEFFANQYIITKAGTDEAVNAAIDAGAEHILLTEGGTVNAVITIDNAYTILDGGGWGHLLDATGAGAINLISASGKEGCTVQNVYVQGNATTLDGITLSGAGKQRVDNCHVNDAGDDAIVVGAGSTVTRCWVEDPDDEGIIGGSSSLVFGNYVDLCGTHGIDMSGSLSTTFGNYVSRCGSSGVRIGSGADTHTAFGNVIYDQQGYGMWLTRANLAIFGNAVVTTDDDGIYANCTDTAIGMNAIYGVPNAKSDIEVTANNTRTSYIGNVCKSLGAGFSERAFDIAGDYGVYIGNISYDHDTVGYILNAGAEHNILFANLSIDDGARITDNSAVHTNIIWDFQTANLLIDANSALELDVADGGRDNAYVFSVYNREATNDRSFGAYIQAGSSANDYNIRGYDHDAANELWHVTGAGLLKIADDLVVGDGKTIGTATTADSATMEADGDVLFNYKIGIGVTPTYMLDITTSSTTLSRWVSTATGNLGVLWGTYQDGDDQANGDNIWEHRVFGQNDADEEVQYGRTFVECADISDGAEDGDWYWYLIDNGAENFVMSLTSEGNLNTDGPHAEFCPVIEVENPTADDYLDWALEDALKPHKPYRGLWSKDGDNSIRIAAGVNSAEEEYDRYARMPGKIATGTAIWAQDARNKIAELEAEVSRLRAIVEGN